MATIEQPILKRPKHRITGRDVGGLIDSVGRYTRFVLFSKMFLGALSLVMILAIVVIPIINADDEGVRLAFSTAKEKNESVPVMKNPTFQGVDEQNQPYLVTADSAIQHDERTIILTNVQADMLTDQQTWLSVKAARGTIDSEAKTMQLSEDVRLFHQDGYEFRTASVDIDMNRHTAKGEQPIVGLGPMGEIRADRFMWDHDKRVLRFEQKVSLMVVPKQ